MYLVYLKYWTLNLMPLTVYPKVLLHPNFSIKDACDDTLARHLKEPLLLMFAPP